MTSRPKVAAAVAYHGVTYALVDDDGHLVACIFNGHGSSCECAPGRILVKPRPKDVCPHLLAIGCMPSREIHGSAS